MLRPQDGCAFLASLNVNCLPLQTLLLVSWNSLACDFVVYLQTSIESMKEQYTTSNSSSNKVVNEVATVFIVIHSRLTILFLALGVC